MIDHPLLGEVKLLKRKGSSSIRLSVHPKRGILVTMPWYCPYSRGESFLESKVQWVIDTKLKQMRKQEKILNSGKTIPPIKEKKELEALRGAARKKFIPRLEELALQHGFVKEQSLFSTLFGRESVHPLYEGVSIKNNSSNWGSCSAKKNINLNIRLLFLPEHLQDFVMLHELCHLRHPNHGPAFHRLLNSLCNGQEKILSRELKEWRLI